ncbi:LIM domain only protein 7-like [Scomber scombrus]|uniref:LIM domain only protein 7-like n=1 Tax=Scomber scombrus TaxID=13677 RepID=UPI002DD91A56|nr:LIM domain only protein 7-like [Scomber scombrus]
MEWRQQTSVSCADAFGEAQRWIEEVTRKYFGCNDFRAALENGVLLCDLINQLKPGIIKRVNRLSTPIAGLDNVNVFLKACGKLGLNESQLFHPGDLQDLSTRVTLRRDESNRRLKNVLITIYWLGRKAHLDAFYSGPHLNFKAFEGLLGLALSKALDEGSNVFVKDSGYKEYCYPEREEFRRMRPSYKRENSANSIDLLDSRALRPNSEGCGSDAEAEQVFRMEKAQHSAQQTKGYIPPPLLRTKQGQENRRGCASPLASNEDIPFSSQPHFTLSSPEWAIDEELFLQALCEGDSEDDYTEADPVLDDLYARRVQQTLHQTSTNRNYDRFLPRYWTPEEETRVRTIYLGSQTRPWYRKMQGLRSKSLSDIPMVYPVRKDIRTASEWNQENRRISVAAKDSEAKWQDDLTKWKNRRRSTKSDLRRKSYDRDHVINQMTNGTVTDFKKETQSGRVKRDQQSPRRYNPAPRPYSTSPPSKSSNSDLRPHTRTLLARSYAFEAPFSPTAPYSHHNKTPVQGSSVEAMPASDGNSLGEETHFGSLASDGAGVTTPSFDCPFSSQTQAKAQGSSAPCQPAFEPVQPENVFTVQISPLVTTTLPNDTTKSTGSRDPTTTVSIHKEFPFCMDSKVSAFCPDSVDQAAAAGLEDVSNQKSGEKSQKTSLEPAAEQGRGQQAAGINKYLSRTVSWSGSASLPRGYRRSEGSSRLSSVITARPFGTKQPRVSSLPRLYNVDDKQGVLLNKEKEACLSPPGRSLLKRQAATGHLRGQYQASIRQKKANQTKQNCKQGEEGKDASLSSQTVSKTNGFHHQPYTQIQLLPQPYLNIQSQQDKTSTLNCTASIDLPKQASEVSSFHQEAQDIGSMGVTFTRSLAELCQLCVDDEIVAVDGVAVAHMSYNQWEDKMTSALQTGSLTMDIRRYGNKDWSTSEGSHHNQQGQSRMTLNLTSSAPVLIGCADHHANSATSTETSVTKLSKFNGQTDNVIQGKVMGGELDDNHSTTISKDYIMARKNEKRRTEFFKQKGSESAISDLQVPSLSPSPSSWSWDREEDRRRQEKWQEEQERLLQEQYQRDQERLEAEWRRAQQDVIGELGRKQGNTFEMTNGGESSARHLRVNRLTNRTREEEQGPESDELKETVSKAQSNTQRVQNDKTTEQYWAKSLSTPALAGSHKQPRGDQRKRKGQSVSKAEQERQQILEEMKKRTQLLTDNSWIRQRSSSFYREPVYVGVPMKRYESLDNLDTLRQSPVSTAMFNYPRPHSAAAGYCAPMCYCLYFVCLFYTVNICCPRMVSGRRKCSVCERALGSGAAMVIESLSLCFHLTCFQCVGCQRHLGGTETRVQVRIRNGKSYCEPCYFQLKCEYWSL